MKNLIVLAYLLCLTAFITAQETTIINTHQSVQEKLDQFLEVAEEVRVSSNIPGVGVTIVYDGQVIHTGGLGVSNRTEKTPVTENTLFAIGSTTKAFTGALAAQLVDAGKLNWKDKISQHLPNFKLKEMYVTQNVTLEDAFKHMTGLGRHDTIWHSKAITRTEIMDQLQYLTFDAGLRERWDYNNLMYLVAGMVVQEVGGQSWDKMIQENIFKPLGMQNSYTTYEAFMQHPKKSTGYAGDGWTPIPHINTNNIGPAGSISSTPKDIAKWLQMWVNKGQHVGTPFLSKEAFEYTTGPNENMSYLPPATVRYYSIGWGGTMTEGKRDIGHSGGIDGQNALISIRPEEGFGIFLMTNQVSDYKFLMDKYAKSIFLDGNFQRNKAKERELATIRNIILFDETLRTKGEQAALQQFETIKGLNIENPMNYIGYQYLEQKDYPKAIFVLKLNTQEFPNSFNVWDSLGEAYMLNKEYDLATKYYEKSLTLNPKNENANRMLAQIKKKQHFREN